MSAAQFRSRITLQQLSGGQDAVGQPVQTWVDVATVWADVRHLVGLEAIKAGADVSVVRASIRIRYKTGLTAGMRVVQGATVYDVQAVMQDVSGKRYTDLVCATGANRG